MFDFKIFAVEARWFEVIISNATESVIVTNSYYLGNDAPRSLLRNLCEMTLLDQATRYLCWQSEPRAEIITLTKNGKSMQYRVALAAKEAFDLCFEGDGLKDEPIEKLYLSGEISFARFFKTVLSAFKEYADGEKLAVYEQEWGTFPFEEFNRMRQILLEGGH